MRILICEDSEHNLVSAREFAEKVKGEHEVEIFGDRPGGAKRGIEGSKYDVVLTDLYMPSLPGREAEPIGLFIAMKALQYNVPVAIVTDGKTHGKDRNIQCLDLFFLEGGNDRIRTFLVTPEPESTDPASAYYSPMKGITSEGKAIKDWEFCFRRMMER